MVQSNSRQSSGGTIFIVGNEMGCAPAAKSFTAKSSACLSGLVMTIPLPKRGFCSNQLKVSRKSTTRPTTRMAGGENLRACASPAILPRVPAIVSCCVVVPCRISAAGVSGDLPCEINVSVICPMFFTPIKNTSVPIPVNASQSISLLSLVGSS